MQLNIIIDFCVGLVPLVGDVIDAVYKCNTRNFLLLEKVLKKRGEENLRRLAAGETETVPPDVQHQLQQQYPSSADVEMGHGRPQTQRTVSPKSHQGNANSRAASRGPSRNVSRNRQNGATSRSQSPARPPVPGHDPPQQDAGFGQPGYGKGYA
ncbi:hypothetical protein KEM55_004933 [Ascosphaera atra]|nr:hypothetical protein KEM55_004933 [Ascosphaera atra]